MSATPDQIFLGLDIGGTKIGLCVGTPGGVVIASDRVPVDHAQAPARMLETCAERLDALRERVSPRAEIMALGAACPGPLDYKGGKFINPPNNPGWHGFALRDWLAERFDVPSAMMNDANAAALAEKLWGAMALYDTGVFLTMSTGMGAGLIIDGGLYEGPLGLAGEIGRIRLSASDDGPVGFGRRGSVEGYCSGPGMAQLAASEAIACIHTNEHSALVEPYRARGTITTQELCEAARTGDPAAKRVTDRVARELGRIMAIMTDVLNPEVFVLGTIGQHYPELFIPGALATVRSEAIPAAAEIVRIVPSSLTDRGNQQALAVAWNALNPGWRSRMALP